MGPERPSDQPQDGAHQTPAYNQHEPWRDDQDDGPQASTPGSSDMHIQSDSDEERGQIQLPVWLRESSKSFRWGWVPVRIRHWARFVAKWSKGPNPPEVQKITPWFAPVQEHLPNLIDRKFPRRIHKAALLTFFYFSWVLPFTLILHHSSQAGVIEVYGKPETIWCGASFW